MKRLILVGSNPRTRGAIPWESDGEIWTLNEAAQAEWVKRWDVLFQIHPKFDWERDNNIANPNHPYFIRAKSGPCLFCKGVGFVTVNDARAKCPHCDQGQYNLPHHRIGKTIIMQKRYKGVPGAKKLPIQEMIDKYCFGSPDDLTSTLAHMLVYAFYLGYRDIELYGFGMESDTEYFQQLPSVKYWIGYGRALGIKIEAPGAAFMKGQHYAYETWAQGYRTRLGMRIEVLREQIRQANIEAIKAEGAFEAINPFRSMAGVTPEWEKRFDEHFRRKQMLSFLNGTVKELENAMAIFDAYHLTGDGPEPGAVKDLLGLTYMLG
jgi:hypothetical protein